MRYFAQLDSNIVANVTVVAEDDAANEAEGIAFCKALVGDDTNWIEVSLSGSIHFRYPAIGMVYDSTNDVFYDQQPYPSWTLNTSTWEWDAPVAIPDDWESILYVWDEASTSWIQWVPEE